MTQSLSLHVHDQKGSINKWSSMTSTGDAARHFQPEDIHMPDQMFSGWGFKIKIKIKIRAKYLSPFFRSINVIWTVWQ